MNHEEMLDHDLHDLAPATKKMQEEVLVGLARSPKKLPSHYLYDERGAILFDQICETPEYYPTRTEVGILSENIGEICDVLGSEVLLVEPGSGSGIKTRLVLENLKHPAGFVPIDIAREQLVQVAAELNRDFPELEVLPVCADFTDTHELPLSKIPAKRRILYMPGSTIGNFEPEDALQLLQQMRELAGAEGGVLLGVDLKKDPRKIEPAYDDGAGVSRDFAMNYLERLNRELDANIDLGAFRYEAPFNEKMGRIEMTLVSSVAQNLRIDGRDIPLEAGERIITEYSYKYDLDGFEALANRADLHIDHTWTDADGLFSVLYLTDRGAAS